MGAGRNQGQQAKSPEDWSFNPRPAWEPGATEKLAGSNYHFFRFQSSPGMGAGRNITTCTIPLYFKSFNPRPAWEPGAT